MDSGLLNEVQALKRGRQVYLSKSGYVAERLAQDIEQLPAKTRLPSEEELAAQYSVSRATIRQALERLWLHGQVARVWGEGTFTVQSGHNPAAIYVDADEVGSLFTRLRNRGVPIKRTYFKLRWKEESYTLQRAFTIADKPALYLCDQLPYQVRGEEIDWDLLQDPTVSIAEIFLRYGERVVKEEADLMISQLPKSAAQLSGLSTQESLLLLKQTTMSDRAQILVHTSAYIDLEAFPHRLVRVIGKGRF